MESGLWPRRPSPALVIALAALFVSLGGAAYAVNLGKNDVKSRHIAKGAVKGSDLHRNAVKPSKIRSGAVRANKIAGGAVGQDALADRAVARKKIKAHAVTTPKIANTAVETAKLADGNVTESKLADGNVTEAKLANGAVTAAKLAAGSVTSAAVKDAFTETIDPLVDTCAADSVPRPGVDADDHVLVTLTGSDGNVLVDGVVSEDQVDIRHCTIGGMNDPDPFAVNVLVID